MKKKSVLLHHVENEDFGILPEILDSRYHSYTTFFAGDLINTTLEKADLLIVLGGPMSVNDESIHPFISKEVTILQKRIKNGFPTLGICLGAQLLAKSLGSLVYAQKTPEFGWSQLQCSDLGRKSCLKHLETTPVFHWHSETFDLPDTAQHLASTKKCNNQGFSIGNHILGVQFHLEINLSKIQLFNGQKILPHKLSDTIQKSKQSLHEWLDSINL
jgi:GMP synthase (glutamine-hydrolysing)